VAFKIRHANEEVHIGENENETLRYVKSQEDHFFVNCGESTTNALYMYCDTFLRLEGDKNSFKYYLYDI
jgi:hypothetical protein